MAAETTMMEQVLERMRVERAAEATRTGVDDALVTLRGIPADADRVRDQFARDLEQVRQSDLEKKGTEWRDREVERIVDAVGGQVERLRGSAEAAVEAIHEWIASQDTAGDVNERLLAEMQEQRAWTRMRAQLDAGADVSTLIGEARQMGDVRALTALRAEWVAYVATVDRPTGPAGQVLDEVDDALAEVAPKKVRAVLRLSRDTRGAAELAERAVSSLEGRVSAYGAFRDNPEPLKKALRVMEIEAASGGSAA